MLESSGGGVGVRERRTDAFEGTGFGEALCDNRGSRIELGVLSVAGESGGVHISPLKTGEDDLIISFWVRGLVSCNRS